MPGIPTGANAAVTLENLNNTLALSRVPIEDYLENLNTIKAKATSKSQMMLAPLTRVGCWIWNVPSRAYTRPCIALVSLSHGSK